MFNDQAMKRNLVGHALTMGCVALVTGFFTISFGAEYLMFPEGGDEAHVIGFGNGAAGAGAASRITYESGDSAFSGSTYSDIIRIKRASGLFKNRRFL